jgi:hypothetical protein
LAVVAVAHLLLELLPQIPTQVAVEMEPPLQFLALALHTLAVEAADLTTVPHPQLVVLVELAVVAQEEMDRPQVLRLLVQPIPVAVVVAVLMLLQLFLLVLLAAPA